MASNEYPQSGRRPPRRVLGVDCARVWFFAQAYIPDIRPARTPASLNALASTSWCRLQREARLAVPKAAESSQHLEGLHTYKNIIQAEADACVERKR